MRFALTFVAILILVSASFPARASLYELDYSGLMGANSDIPFDVALVLDLDDTGAVTSFVSGLRGGVDITGLSDYAAADNVLYFTDPFVDFAGLSFTDANGVSYNLFNTDDFYGELNSASNPDGWDNNLSTVTSVKLTPVQTMPVQTTPVPEPASLLLLAGGCAGLAGLRLARGRRAA